MTRQNLRADRGGCMAVPNTTMTAELRTRFRALLWTWRVRVESDAVPYPAELTLQRPNMDMPDVDLRIDEPDDDAQDAFWCALAQAVGDGFRVAEPPTEPELEDRAGDGEYEYRGHLLRHALNELELRGRTDFVRLLSDLGWALGQPLQDRWAGESRQASRQVSKALALRARLRADTNGLLQIHRGSDSEHDCPCCAAYSAMLHALEHEPTCDPFLLNPKRDGAGRPSQPWRYELRHRLHGNGVPELIARDLLQAVGLLPIPADMRSPA